MQSLRYCQSNKLGAESPPRIKTPQSDVTVFAGTSWTRSIFQAYTRDENPDFTDDEDGLSLTFTAFYGTIDNAGQPVLGAELPTNGDENILASDPDHPKIFGRRLTNMSRL